MANAFLLIISLISCYFLTKILIKPLTRLTPDVPNHRSSHNKTTPRGGGLSIILASSICFVFLGQFEFLWLILLVITSFSDDVKSLDIKYKFLSQFITVLTLFFNSDIKTNLILGNNVFLDIMLSIFIILIGCTLINFSNFIDGIDGLLCSVMIALLIFSSFVITISVVPLIGAILGFLIWNWSPAKIFLGDVGSNFLGGYFVYIIFNTNSVANSVGLILISFPLLVDCSVSIIRRFFYNQNIFKPHSLHLFQRLVQSGWKHSQVSILNLLLVIFLGFSWIFGGIKFELFSCAITFIIFLFIEKFYAKPFKI